MKTYRIRLYKGPDSSMVRQLEVACAPEVIGLIEAGLVRVYDATVAVTVAVS